MLLIGLHVIMALNEIKGIMIFSAEFHQIVLTAVLIWAVLAFIVTQFITEAPYGKHDNWSENTLRFKQKTAWILMESPAAIVFTLCFFSQGLPEGKVPYLLFGMWALHYYHRAFIYPFLLIGNQRIPWIVVLLGGLYCASNGYLNGTWVGVLGDYSQLSLNDPRIILGTLVYALGFMLNKHSDYILRQLGKQKPSEFQVPHGGGFKLVSNPHYLGEILTWLGFAIACSSLAAWSFVFMTMANLVPRALSTHKWYHGNFNDYPKQRKAIFPKLL